MTGKQIIWTTKRYKLGSLVPWEHNPVQLSDRAAKLLAKNLREKGQDLPYVAAAPIGAKGGTTKSSLAKKIHEKVTAAAEKPKAPDKAQVLSTLQSAHADLAKEADRAGGIVKVPDLVDRIKKAHPDLSTEQVHGLMKEMHNSGQIILQKLNMQASEPRASEGIQTPGGTGFYVKVTGEKPSAPAPAAKAFTPADHHATVAAALDKHGQTQDKLTSLVDLRKEMSHLPREQQDAVLKDMQKHGKISLVGLEGRQGITQAEREASIPHPEGPSQPSTGYVKLRQQGAAPVAKPVPTTLQQHPAHKHVDGTPKGASAFMGALPKMSDADKEKAGLKKNKDYIQPPQGVSPLPWKQEEGEDLQNDTAHKIRTGIYPSKETEVDPKDLVFVQEGGVVGSRMQGFIDQGPPSKALLPTDKVAGGATAIRGKDGKLYLLEGNHRAMLAMAYGEPIKIHVADEPDELHAKRG